MNTTPPFVVAIPARYASTRLPAKPLRTVGGVPIVVRVAQRALQTGALTVVVAVDDMRIAAVLKNQPVQVCMTRTDHASGSDRLAECITLCDWKDDTIVVNLQGDEPFAPVAGVLEVVRSLVEDGASMATLATPIEDRKELSDPNVVKLVRNVYGHALYFSRAPLPWSAASEHHDPLPNPLPFLRHIGIYAYRARFLSELNRWPRTPLEQIEFLEQLRVLERGHAIAVRLTPEPFPPGIDTEADLQKAEHWWQQFGHTSVS